MKYRIFKSRDLKHLGTARWWGFCPHCPRIVKKSNWSLCVAGLQVHAMIQHGGKP